MTNETDSMHRRRCLQRRAACVLATGALLAACSGRAPKPMATEYLDEATGTTFTRMSEPIVLYDEEPTLAVNVRDYVFLAPVAVNRMGQVSQWLWLGAWSTIDRGASGVAGDPAGLSAIQLVVDGEPMELDMGGARTDLPGAGEAPYATPVDTARNLYVPVTASQLQRLAAARRLAMRSSRDDGTTQTWQPWDGQPAGLRAFLELIGDGATAPVAAAREQ